jgi:hypothetical protein
MSDLRGLQTLWDIEDGDPATLIARVQGSNLCREEIDFLAKYIRDRWRLPHRRPPKISADDARRIALFVVNFERSGVKTEAAIQDAMDRFGVGRSTVFDALAKHRKFAELRVGLMWGDLKFSDQTSVMPIKDPKTGAPLLNPDGSPMTITLRRVVQSTKKQSKKDAPLLD